ncbi:MAG TPA: Gfo/Idh/MocA family oxidoreductase [Cyclobacteriaceae bacterium]|nr:Gfo/Idh/MocA family oxidoreductase [Cyclobacteriaceae bacterium]
MKTFALIGVAGFIAPRHLQAIRDSGNELVAALDKFDSVGIMDSYFPKAEFFTEFERFDRHLEKIRRQGKRVDYVSICSPNYLHDSHIRFALRHGADAICEKPLVLNPWNLDALEEIEKETGKRTFTIFQLRLHPVIQQLKAEIDASPPGKRFSIDLNYITSRGNWYSRSWKADESKSGGIATNIGIHFFDMLLWIFGDCRAVHAHNLADDHASGDLRLERADVRWSLSINADHLPEEVRKAGKRTFRSMKVDGREIEFSEGFTDLHTRCYEHILSGEGFGIKDAKPSIEVVYKLRKSGTK